MGQRRTARECAIQMLYEHDVGKQPQAEILRTFWQMNDHPERVEEFANQLFQGTLGRLGEIDGVIQRHTKNWRLGRLAVVDRNILRLAVFEFLSDDKTPDTVVINEALEIARKYSTQESALFVNGVLDSVKNELIIKRRHNDGKSD